MTANTHANTAIKDAERRARRAWFEDGLPDLGCGTLCLLGATGFLIATRLPGLFLVLPVVFFAVALAYNRGFFWLKARITDRRIGYVRFDRPRSWRAWLPIAIGVAGLRVLTDTLEAVPAIRPWMTFWPVLVVSGGLVALAVTTGLRRYLPLALVPLAAAAAAHAAGIGEPYRTFTLVVALGAAAIVSGGIALRNFLRRHPTPLP